VAEKEKKNLKEVRKKLCNELKLLNGAVCAYRKRYSRIRGILWGGTDLRKACDVLFSPGKGGGNRPP